MPPVGIDLFLLGSFLYAQPVTETILLGGVALRARKKVEYDSANMKITNDEAADQSPFMRRLAPRDSMNWY